MDTFFMPVLSHFQNENPWTACTGRLQFKLVPTVPKDENGDPIFDQATITTQVWEGPWALEFSTVEDTFTLPLTEEALQELERRLAEWRAVVDARPARTLSENIARRVEEKTE